MHGLHTVVSSVMTNISLDWCVCPPQDGRLLLLEHGASTWPLVNLILARGCCHHVRQFGCYANRQILDLVKQVSASATPQLYYMHYLLFLHLLFTIYMFIFHHVITDIFVKASPSKQRLTIFVVSGVSAKCTQSIYSWLAFGLWFCLWRRMQSGFEVISSKRKNFGENSERYNKTVSIGQMRADTYIYIFIYILYYIYLCVTYDIYMMYIIYIICISYILISQTWHI